MPRVKGVVPHVRASGLSLCLCRSRQVLAAFSTIPSWLPSHQLTMLTRQKRNTGTNMRNIYHPRHTPVLKRLGVLLIMAVFIVGIAGCDPTNGTGPGTFPGAGSGTAADPYQITNWTQLDAVRHFPNKHFILMNDLGSTAAGYAALAGPSANDGKGWQPIGGAVIDVDLLEEIIAGLSDEWEEAFELVDPFAGRFDGQGFEISHLFINRPFDPALRDVVLIGDYSNETWHIDNGNDYPRPGWQHP